MFAAGLAQALAPNSSSPVALTNPDKQNHIKVSLGKAGDRKLEARLHGFVQKVKQEAADRARTRNLPSAAGQDLGLGNLSRDREARVTDRGEIQVYVEMDAISAVRLDQLSQQGLRVELSNDAQATVQGWVAYNQLDQLASFPFVSRIKFPAYSFRRAGSVTTQGDSLLQASGVRSLPPPGPYDGAGIKVGVISDGADSRASSISTGDLPAAGITIYPALPGSGNEGTAMLEIVHDLAPGASLFFGGPHTSAEMVQLINWMANTAQCDVIADDLGFFAEPFFEDGPVAQAARSAVTISGRVYCSAAGNQADTHYQGLYSNPQTGITVDKLYLNDFDPGPGVDQLLNFKVNPGDTIQVVLQWNDKWDASGNDYDLYLLNPQTKAILGKSDANQNGNDDPLEIASYTNNSRSVQDVGVGVVLYSGAPRTLEIYAFDGFGNDSNLTAADSIFGHPAVAEVISCAAINASQFSSDSIAYYSSRGPATIEFPAQEERQVPFITGVDGVSITGAGGFYNPFYGTSASAPHIAGICALLRQKDPQATPAMIRDALRASATDQGQVGYDYTYGYGLANALSAIDMLAPKTVLPPVMDVTPNTSLRATGTIGGLFQPPILQYTITNSGGDTLTWAVSKSQPWLDLNQSSGTLNPGESTQIAISFAGTTTLGIGSYVDILSFINTSNGDGDTTRTVTATISRPNGVPDWGLYK